MAWGLGIAPNDEKLMLSKDPDQPHCARLCAVSHAWFLQHVCFSKGATCPPIDFMDQWHGPTLEVARIPCESSAGLSGSVRIHQQVTAPKVIDDGKATSGSF